MARCEALAYGLLRDLFSWVGIFLWWDGFGRCCGLRLRCGPTAGGGLLLVVEWIGGVCSRSARQQLARVAEGMESSCAGGKEQGLCRLDGVRAALTNGLVPFLM